MVQSQIQCLLPCEYCSETNTGESRCDLLFSRVQIVRAYVYRSKKERKFECSVYLLSTLIQVLIPCKQYAFLE